MTLWFSSALANHLWQSTLFAGAVWLATLALRRNHARVRYWLWVAASLKFVVPFSWLVSLGAQVQWGSAPVIVQPAASFVVDQILTAPVFDTAAAPVVSFQPASVIPLWLLAPWLTGFVTVLALWWRQWLPIRAALRRATVVTLDSRYEAGDLTVMSSPSTFEPGVVGIRHPVLLLPDGLLDRLTPAQMNALIAHERCHVRHRDNLFAAMHMLTEALFWFHPLAWWIERRMVDERERACDEAVLDAGSAPRDYAEGILEVCRSAVVSPLVCIAGVSGSNLRHRIEVILLGTRGRPLTFGRRLALGGMAAAVTAFPLVAGALQVPVPSGGIVDPNLRFEVASIKPNDASSGIVMMRALPGRFEAINVPVRLLLPQALLGPEDRLLPEARIIGAPGWVDTERYTINAKMPDGAPQSGVSVMLTNLLKDRFKLETHSETRELPVFHLVRARSDGRLGPDLKESSAECQAMIASRSGGPGAGDTRTLPGTPGGLPLFDPVTKPCGSGRSGPGILGGGGYPISWLVQKLSELTGRPVIDRTGLGGLYDFALTFASEPGMYRIPGGMPLPPIPPSTADPDAPSLSTALREQLGLRLENQRGTVDVVVIDHLEKPTID